MNKKLLEGKVAVITGAGGGLGRSHALLMASHGAKIVVNDIGCNADGTGTSDAASKVCAEIKALGGEAAVSAEKVGSFASGEKIVKTALDAFGRLDILVNNAGILRDRTILKMSEEEWDSIISVHLKGSMACLKAAAQIFKDQGTGGRIINTSSSSGLLGNFGQANYGAAKIGVHALTRIAAWELAKYKVTVNAIAPIANTRMLATIPQMQESYPLNSMTPGHVSPLVLWLASDEAAGVTGQTFGIEGGRIFSYRMATSHGVQRAEAAGPWPVEEIGPVIERVISW
jgi:NAD(P)-dependent dehydrogenase (short-subunit alcohol dehydrogenase family)